MQYTPTKLLIEHQNCQTPGWISWEKHMQSS